MDHGTAGTELFVRPTSRSDHHGAYRRVGRDVDGEEMTAAVFPELAAGTYDILDAVGGTLRHGRDSRR